MSTATDQAISNLHDAQPKRELYKIQQLSLAHNSAFCRTVSLIPFLFLVKVAKELYWKTNEKNLIIQTNVIHGKQKSIQTTIKSGSFLRFVISFVSKLALFGKTTEIYKTG